MLYTNVVQYYDVYTCVIFYISLLCMLILLNHSFVDIVNIQQVACSAYYYVMALYGTGLLDSLPEVQDVE